TIVPHSTFPLGQPYLCPSPDGTNMCNQDDERVKTGWFSAQRGEIGFMWDAAQGTAGLGTFAFPYVHILRINLATMTRIDEPVLSSPSTAFAFPSAAPNARGDLGVSVAFGGGS